MVHFSSWVVMAHYGSLNTTPYPFSVTV